MKKYKKVIITITIILLLVVVLFCPVNKKAVWVNDDIISDIGHYKNVYYNILGIELPY